MKNLIYLPLPFMIYTTSLFAEEPILDRNHTINATNWSWRIDSHQKHSLKLFQTDTAYPAIHYDLSSCMFCSGEEDGCNQDGIFSIKVKKTLNEPILAVVCHIGAHSRLLQLFAPLRDKNNAVYTITGDYIIDYEIDPHGITVKYDRRNKNGEHSQKLSRWPQTDSIKKK